MFKGNRLVVALLAALLASQCESFSIMKMSSSVPEASRRTFLSRVVTTTAGVGVVMAGGVAGGPLIAAAALPTTGIKAPSFKLPSSREAINTTLDDLTAGGKWTVLYFYPGAFTSGCTLEARGFQRDMDQYRKLDAQIVGVSVDPVEKNAQFCNSEGLDFFMLSDEGGTVSKKYGSALSVPGFGTFSNRQTYLIDPTGNLRWVFTDVESHVARHSAEVLEKLTELQTA
jgi:peroxiredoxin Q/BCP|uniref:thioredoxin-dependent peroxiredoxin n=1 Tax=Attheya septentrionalis TaxID=420275 RepID=A0A7S2XNK5_9STRA|mmetsp:Transcript_23693/g.42742  ORF Transcript_23693/g.42742 Transcript_23693/m.42742 type:complete len:228 (+) Transcript_23693:90-773(+)|eukprot:CAMPEP_0198292878 /NCGR_PEP_ID=MMETSP1449-20131203/14521_1 /TAXON_ID=420275 /ORGANISM="Attheya septentrionalis, Strain CCMP2084" /LENGTH=227 /DNA_ID=CAMNT_0043992225 /DNA_START=42 /DNA_END=725 /DNA_ORIENTATION=-